MSIICLCAHAYQALLRLDRANHTIRFPREKKCGNSFKLFVNYSLAVNHHR